MTKEQQNNSPAAAPRAQQTWRDKFYDERLRGYFSQAFVLLIIAWGLYEVVYNTQSNLKNLNKNFGYDFLGQAAGFDIITSFIPYSSTSTYASALMVGFYNTIFVSVLGIILATILGFLIGIMRLSRNKVISAAATLYIEVIRNTPILLQIFMWYALVLKPLPGPKQAINLYDAVFISNRGIIMPLPVFGEGAIWAIYAFVLALVMGFLFRRYARRLQAETGKILPQWWITFALIVVLPLFALAVTGFPVTYDMPALAGFNFKGGMTLVPEFLALLAALVVFTASFIAEIVRSGIQAVSKGQSEAAGALGLSRGQTLRLVVLPQAMRVMIPPLASQFLSLTKNSSLAIAIGYPDLVATGGTVLNQSGKAIEIVSIWMVVYLSLSLITAGFMGWFNTKMKLVER